MNFLEQIYHYVLDEYRKKYVLLGALFLFVSLLEIMTAGYSKLFLDAVTGTKDERTFYVLGVAFLANIIILLGFQLYKKYLAVQLSEELLYNKRIKIFRNILQDKKDDQYESVHKILVELPVLIDFCISTIPAAIFDGVSIFIVAVLLIVMKPQFIVIALIAIGMSVFIHKYFNPKLLSLNQGAITAFSRATGVFSENLNNIAFINAQGIEGYAENRLSDVLRRGINLRYRIRNINLFIIALSTMITFLPQLFLLVAGSIAIIRGNWTVGDMILYLTLLQMLLAKLNSILSINFSIQNVRAIMASYLSYYIRTSECTEKSNIDSIDQIIVKDFVLSYTKKVINQTFNRGDFILFRGGNGSGKTTFINHLIQILPQNKGHIQINNAELSKVKYSCHSRSIGVVLQRMYLFNDSVRENINCDRGIEEKAMIELYQKIFGMDVDGKYLDKSIQRLSGGERRKVEIIRALATQPSLLIFDEVDTYLDADSFSALLRYLQQISDQHIIFMITHKQHEMIDGMQCIDFDQLEAQSS